jgi:hypothetical protein
MCGDRMLEPDQGRWVTYAEAGELLGVSAQAARMLAKRRGWARRTPNAFGDRALVLLPADAIVQPRSASFAVHTGNVIPGDRAEPNGHDQVNVRALEGAVEALREQLGIVNRQIAEERALAADERARADRAERQADEERTRADQERGRADRAEQRAASDRVWSDEVEKKVEAIRLEIAARRSWSVWRRLRWALGRSP